MKTTPGVTFGVLAAIALLVSVAYAFANAPAAGNMGVWGYVASQRDASLSLAKSQSATATLRVAHVSAPEDAWIVVHVDDNGMPGERVGLLHVTKGISSDLRVRLAGVTGSSLLVAIHADRGTPGRFDFDMDKKETSPDRPYFVGGRELAQAVALR